MSQDYPTILKGLLSAASSRLVEEGRGTNRVELTPGTLPAWDDCCEGQLYLRVVEIFPTMGRNSPFPQIDASQSGVAGSQCVIHGVAVHIGLGVIRCAATVDDQGNSPTSAEVTADADLMLDDMNSLLEVLVCQAQDLPGILRLKIERWTPQGVEGGCAGGEWGAYILIDPCLCRS